MKGTRQPKSLRTAIILALGMGLSKLALAVGLGPIQVDSYMGQPLKASIRISGISDSDALSSVVQLADNAAYRARGIVKTPEQSGLNFRIVKSGSGHIILVSSASQIKEPFINFILSMKSGGQVITREYAVFLNPDPAVQAGIAPAVEAIATPAKVTKPQSVKPVNLPSKEVVAASSTSQGWGGADRSVQPTTANTAPVKTTSTTSSDYYYDGSGSYGPVKPGETLYSIARATRPSESVSVNAMMRAIFNANRSAFATSNLNSLMVGHTLRIPSSVGGVSRPESPQTLASIPVTKTKVSNNNKNNRTKVATVEEETNTVLVKPTVTETVSTSESTPVPPSKITPASENTETKPSIIPIEMTPEQIAEAKASAEKAAQVAQLEKPATSPESGMKLDGADSVNLEKNSEISEPKVAIEEKTTTSTLVLSTPEATSTTETPKPKTEPLVSSPETAQKPTPSKVTAAPSPAQEAQSSLPFGLEIWQVGAGGAAILALGGLGYFLSRRKKVTVLSEEDIAQEDLDALAAQHPDLNFNTYNHEVITAHSEEANISLDKFDEEDIETDPFGDEFFKDMDSNGNIISNHVNNSESIEPDDSFLQQDFAELDDFFNEMDGDTEAATSSVTATSITSLDDMDDFFADPEEVDAATTSTTEIIEEFKGLDDFFADVDSEPESTSPTTTASHSIDNLDDLDILLTSEVDEGTEQSVSIPATSTFVDDNFASLEDDFFNVDEQITTTVINSKQVSDDIFDATDSTTYSSTSASQSSSVDKQQFDFDGLAVSGIDEKIDTAEASPVISTNEIKQTTESIDVLSVSEPSAADVQAMDINLDLATAYIKSGVKPEKAKMWLDEVLEKGTAEQKAIAEDLYKKLI